MHRTILTGLASVALALVSRGHGAGRVRLHPEGSRHPPPNRAVQPRLWRQRRRSGRRDVGLLERRS